MFNEVERKIKILAVVFTILGIAGSVIYGVILLIDGNVGIGLATILVGSLLSWATNCLVYGFGELVENSAIIAEEVQQSEDAEQDKKAVMGAGDWKCAGCGRINKSYVSSCCCGKSKHE